MTYPVSIGNIQLHWVQNVKYLGVYLSCAKTFQVDFAETRRKFFSSVNSILSKCNFTSDIVKLQLMESHCLPILLYAVESLNLSKSRILELNSWWNSVYRKIFNYHKWESVKELIFMLGRLDLHHIINLKSLKFVINMSKRSNNSGSDVNVLLRSYKMSGEYAALFRKYGCKDNWSFTKIKAMIYLSFSSFKTNMTI